MQGVVGLEAPGTLRGLRTWQRVRVGHIRVDWRPTHSRGGEGEGSLHPRRSHAAVGSPVTATANCAMPVGTTTDRIHSPYGYPPTSHPSWPQRSPAVGPEWTPWGCNTVLSVVPAPRAGARWSAVTHCTARSSPVSYHLQVRGMGMCDDGRAMRRSGLSFLWIWLRFQESERPPGTCYLHLRQPLHCVNQYHILTYYHTPHPPPHTPPATTHTQHPTKHPLVPGRR